MSRSQPKCGSTRKSVLPVLRGAAVELPTSIIAPRETERTSYLIGRNDRSLLETGGEVQSPSPFSPMPLLQPPIGGAKTATSIPASNVSTCQPDMSRSCSRGQTVWRQDGNHGDDRKELAESAPSNMIAVEKDRKRGHTSHDDQTDPEVRSRNSPPRRGQKASLAAPEEACVHEPTMLVPNEPHGRRASAMADSCAPWSGPS
jgi:hypothetical protein